ncbi:MAG: sulfatase/phosphatase domain-containing protein, partial [Pseudomonadota bacterium]
NGASSADHYEQKLAPYLLETFNNSLENMGKATSWVSIGPQWAEASTAPFSLYKKYTRQGGVVAPMIIAGPDVTHRGEVTAAFSTVMDVAPTILDYARFDLAIDQASAFPMLGESMRELLAGSASRIHADEYSVAMAHIGKAFFRYGDWKLVTLNAPFDESKFELYNLANDPGEQVDLRQAVPEQYARMVDLWRRESKRQGVQLP